MARRTTPLRLVIAAALLAVGRRAHGRPAPARPNVVLILADDSGYGDVGCFGAEIAAPAIDGVARDGVTLTQFYNRARCCPTRAALLTGRDPHAVGVGAMLDGYAAAQRRAADGPAYLDHLSFDSPTVADLLRSAGYRTMMSGKWHLGGRPTEWPVGRGFDRSFVQIKGAMNYFGGDAGPRPREPMAMDDKPFVPPHDGFYTTDAFTDHAIEFVDEAVRQESGGPFFLCLPYDAAHWPLQVAEADVAAHAHVYDDRWQQVRVGRWKPEAEPGRPWELYGVDTDRVETHDVTADRADVAARLAEQHADWADRGGVIPWPPDEGGR